ncbi:MAG TPA: PadR family transcriptional regulator [Bryobacteraceae bacterium]|nr:PadR family transcriptional regulator [Bryobacteraceae bacterium]
MNDERLEFLQGTLDMLVLRTLLFGPLHGHAIATSIERTSRDVLQVDHGSLYPALHRLERQKLIASSWGTSDNNRRAKFYSLTAAGRQQLNRESSKWEQFVQAVARIMLPAREED